MCEVSSCWGPFLIEFHGRNKNNNPKNNAEQFHIWFPPAPLAWNHRQLYKCREVFTTFPCALRVNVELMCAGGCQQAGRPLLLITDMSCLNVMLEHRCNIQASAAPPFGRVWRTHAIPHICSISDCITQDLLTFSAIANGSCYHSNRCFTRNTFCVNLVDLFPFPPLRNIKKKTKATSPTDVNERSDARMDCVLELLSLWVWRVKHYEPPHLLFSLNRKGLSVPELLAVPCSLR